ncbi:EAL domain-containing protein [Aestuariivita sp.]|jgi:EAL domain-containing protein (putative c-di-GMP-specific phosphodiesterase class I)|uniref:EAL domain-containing protein n=1 Tax=Aestuariivita sp. TaxID=1872407 RepID=UPI00216D6DE0|nr:EAL domain-containing protein [Aestuariivita sp.]MCE8006892.1 EAL domain-containing protein [Aestuariivita sp.]
MPKTDARLADLPPGAENPLNLAVTLRNDAVLINVDRALAAGEVLLAFQPVMQASAQRNVAFYEGLLRVLDETGRVIPAAQFMAAAEESELGRKLDCMSLKLGLEVLREHPQLRLSINMSARSVGYKRWIRILEGFLLKDPTLGERLILEITEESAMKVPDIVIGFMAELQTTGVCFALDNYGAGLSAVRYFKDFYFDAVKIDGQFINGIHADPDKQVVTGALMSVANQFDMFTVASKVEDAADAAYLADVGVDCLQGFLFGPPSVRRLWLPANRARSA